MNREIILLPSLLIASGFECLTTTDVKFLNNYRKHLDRSKYNLDEIFMATPDDFELGGILNPFNEMGSIQSLVHRYCGYFTSYPYLTRNDIKSHVYSFDFNSILTRLKDEAVEELNELQLKENHEVLEGIEANKFTVKNLKQLQEERFYHKTLSLHLCGFGDVMLDAFNRILARLTSNLVK